MIRRALGVTGAGLAVAVGIGLLVGDPMGDVVTTAGVAAGTALITVVLGWAALTPVRRRPVRDQALAVVAVAIVGTLLGIVVAARAMFISGHDLRALLVVLVAAGSAGLAAALRLGARVGADSRLVEDLARGIGDGRAHRATGASPTTGELARLASEIAAVSTDLEESRRREGALEQSRRELVAWISHDLRGPLASIQAMAEALDDGVVADFETVDRYHRAIGAETERLAGMVDDLFELSRISAGSTRLQLEPVELAAVIDDAVDRISARADRDGVRIEGVVADPITVEASVPELSRAIDNLLDNAIRHTPAGGSITVSGLNGGSTVQVVVEDECGGIPDDDLDRVFDLAFRGDSARGRQGGGGLGLTIAKGLVEAHQGSIAVANRDRGCRFTLDLPC